MSYTRTVWVDNSAPFIDAAGLNNIELGLVDVDARVTVAEAFRVASGGRLASAEVNITFASGVISTLVPLASGGQHVLGASALMTNALAAAIPGLLYVASGTVAQPTVNAPLYRSDGATFRKVAPGIIPVVKNLPTNPNDGDEIYFLADDTNGVMWHLRYRKASASIYKWEFIGGQALQTQANTTVSMGTLSAFTDFSDALPTIVLPLSGDYDLEYGAELTHTGTGQGIFIQPVATGLAAGSQNAYIQFVQAAAANSQRSVQYTRYRATGISGTLKLQYFVGATGGSADRRKLLATPVRVG